ncbi:hypothetical protein N7456_009231 [Penicillium angulare]|uniref:Uncharacterized protein n=1 Tax=Penicillium angulare TaxID=116970 RepID=A0A9W9F4J8_9EURO|nr:hypothetical protein N7456_009231 [Penicillium angulare]
MPIDTSPRMLCGVDIESEQIFGFKRSALSSQLQNFHLPSTSSHSSRLIYTIHEFHDRLLRSMGSTNAMKPHEAPRQSMVPIWDRGNPSAAHTALARVFTYR